FPVGEVRGGQGRADGVLLLPPGRSAKCQGPIVNRAGATEGLRELSGLLMSREESIFEGLLDDHRDSFRHTGKDDKCCQSWAKRRRCAHSSPSKLARWMEYSFADLDKNISVGRVMVTEESSRRHDRAIRFKDPIANRFLLMWKYRLGVL